MEGRNFENIPNSVINEETISDEVIEKLSTECFLREYEILCKKYKMGLKGCGCCGSPYLYIKDKYIDNINYNEELNKVIIEYNETIEEYFKKENMEE